jgi:hypothetical protein
MGRADKQVIQEGSDEDDIPLTHKKRKVGTGAQQPRGRGLLTMKFSQPSHEFTFGVGMNFISYPLVLTPLV